MNNREPETAMLVYYPGKGLYVFGHVALSVQPIADLLPNGYLSFTPGEGKAADPIVEKAKTSAGANIERSTYVSSTTETARFGSRIEIQLPPCEPEQLIAAVTAFTKLDRSEYAGLSNNCATNVVNFLKSTGHIAHDEILITPQAVAKRAAEIAMGELAKERAALLKIRPPAIVDLLKNDVKRLELQIKYDEISHYFLKSKGTKTAKIDKLNALIHEGEALQTATDYQRFHEHLLQARTLGSKTAGHLEECLHYFPLDQCPASYRNQQTELKRDVEFYKREREIILRDDELPPREIILALLRNDIYRLEATLQKDAKSTLGHLKDVSKKINKIQQLKQLEHVYQAASPDWVACLQQTQKLMTDPTMEGKTTEKLQDCLNRFPYDKLPYWEDLQAFLVGLNARLEMVTQPKGLGFFAKREYTAEQAAWRQCVPAEVDGLSSKAVYDHFQQISALLTKKNPTMQAFSSEASRLAEPILEKIHATLAALSTPTSRNADRPSR